MSLASRTAVAALCIALFGTTAVTANFFGDGTYYGDNGWAGWCAGNLPNQGKAWPPPSGQFGVRVALNGPQFANGANCGRKIMVRGLNGDCTTCGYSPISGNWQQAQVTNLCPECAHGSLDFGKAGDGRWKIEWYWADEGAPQAGLTSQSQTVTRATAKRPTKLDWRRVLAKQRAARAKKQALWKAYWARKRAATKSRPKPTFSPAEKKKRQWKAYWARVKAARAKGRKLAL